MNRSTSRRRQSNAANRNQRGQVISLATWKAKREQEARRQVRQHRRRHQSPLRFTLYTVMVLEGMAVLSSWIPSPYQFHSIVLAWALGIIAAAMGLWLNVRVDRQAGQLLAWTSVGMLVALIPGLFRIPV